MRAKQIIVLEIEIDASKVPPPDAWDWNDVGVQMNGHASVKLIASGRAQFLREPAAEQAAKFGGTD